MLSAKPWKPNGTLILCVFIFSFYLILLFGAGLSLQFSGKKDFDHNSIAYLLLVTLSLHGVILVATCVYLWLQRVNWAEAFGFNSPQKGHAALWGVFAALIFLPVGYATQLLSLKVISWFTDSTEKQEAVKLLTEQKSLGNQIYMGLFAIVIAPVAEEIFFRGILYPTIKQAGYPRIALWCTALVFGAIHLNAAIFVPLVILALAMVFLYEKTNNLLAPIVAHSLFNTVGVIAVYSDDIGNFFYRLFHHSS